MIVLLACALIYIVMIIALALRLQDIKRNPDLKYDEEERFQRATDHILRKNLRHGKFFKSLSHKYSVIYGLPIGLLTMGLVSIICTLLRNIINIPGGSTAIRNNNSAILYLPILFMSICSLPLLSFYIKTPIATIISEEMFNSAERKTDWKKAHLFALVSFIIMMPFLALSMNNYAYYNAKEIIVSQFFEIGSTRIGYEEISRIDRYFHYDKSNKISSMHYVIHGEGSYGIDVLFSDEIKQTFAIHNFIISINPDVLPERQLEADELSYIRKYSMAEQDMLYVIFR